MRPLLVIGLSATLGAPVLLAPAQRLRADNAPAATATSVPSLAGRWTLNHDQSEDARAKMREAMGGARPDGGAFGGGGGFGGRRGGGGGGGFGGRGGFGGGRRGAPADGGQGDPGRGGAMRSFFEPPASLAITQSPTELSLDGGDAGTAIVHPDGKKAKDERGEVTAKWSGAELVVETRTERGATLTAAYMLAPGKRQLFVTSRLDRRGRTVTVRRVYDAAPETTRAPATPPPG